MTRSYCARKGICGVRMVADYLVANGIDARMTRGSHPFDIIVYKLDKPVAGIENKDLGQGVNGTRIDKGAKRRKLGYAERHGLTRIYTTVTLRHLSKMGYREGVRNLHIDCFTYDMEVMVRELQQA